MANITKKDGLKYYRPAKGIFSAIRERKVRDRQRFFKNCEL